MKLSTQARRRTPVCPYCKSPRIAIDATAEWDNEGQRWELRATHSCATCDECGEYSNGGPDWIVVEVEQPQQAKEPANV